MNRASMAIAAATAALAGCATPNGGVDVVRLAPPEKSLLLPACKPPPYPADEGNPDSRARWLIEDGQCDALNRTKIDGLQNYARAVSARGKKQ